MDVKMALSGRVANAYTVFTTRKTKNVSFGYDHKPEIRLPRNPEVFESPRLASPQAAEIRIQRSVGAGWI
jgi:hypothetical protein